MSEPTKEPKVAIDYRGYPVIDQWTDAGSDFTCYEAPTGPVIREHVRGIFFKEYALDARDFRIASLASRLAAAEEALADERAMHQLDLHRIDALRSERDGAESSLAAAESRERT